MNSIQIADETFVAADPAAVGRAVADPASWRRWWPDLLSGRSSRTGPQGPSLDRQRPADRHHGDLAGAVLDGVILHYFLHAEPAGVAAWQLAKMNLAKLTHQRRVAGKRMAFEVKRTLEAARPVGMPPAGLILGRTQRRQGTIFFPIEQMRSGERIRG